MEDKGDAEKANAVANGKRNMCYLFLFLWTVSALFFPPRHCFMVSLLVPGLT